MKATFACHIQSPTAGHGGKSWHAIVVHGHGIGHPTGPRTGKINVSLRLSFLFAGESSGHDVAPEALLVPGDSVSG